MFGYVRPVLGKLSEEDRDRFQSAYCGLCYELDARYGILARWILNYDFTFLAILLSDQTEVCTHYRCPCKGFRSKERLCSNEGLAAAADESLILTYWKICDEIEDGGFWKSLAWRVPRFLMGRAYHKAAKLRPVFAEAVEKNLCALHDMEQSKIASLDRPADAFAKILERAADGIGSDAAQQIHRQMLYHLGRWIYLIDALDDLKKDAEAGTYNPLIYRFQLENGVLDPESRQRLVATIDHSVNLVSAAFELLDRSPWTGVLENIIYYGLPTAGRMVLEGKWNSASEERSCLHRKKSTLENERMERDT